MASPVRVFVYHHNRLFRECLAKVLSRDNGFRVEEVDHREESPFEALENERPDAILVDINLPDNLAIALTEHVRDRAIETKVIVLVSALSQEKIVECVAAGAHGCLLEQSTIGDLRTAIENVLRGETFCSPDIVQSMFRQLSKLSREAQWRTRFDSAGLTAREMEVLRLIAGRLSNKQIAKRLCVSLYTVKNHVHNILEKLQVENRFEAVEYARSRSWLAQRELSAEPY